MGASFEHQDVPVLAGWRRDGARAEKLLCGAKICAVPARLFQWSVCPWLLELAANRYVILCIQHNF